MLQPQDVRVTLERMLAEDVAPIARRYGYDPLDLSLGSQWKPIVLIIGNYSSGKSTLINELLGVPVQRTGQAPTDDCFTILTGCDEPGPVRVVEEIPGQTVVNDSALPFGSFKHFGQRFVAHFLMKRVNSPALGSLAIIDSPGMLDSVTELDRGYDYQQVIGQLAELADLVVLVFDPHRAGTIKETYVSIRSTLPASTSEDRVLFVMNRIDECRNLQDLLRCYGALCWNLSQMTGRKDIPRVFLTYSPELNHGGDRFVELAGERKELIDKIEQAPRLQVSHLLGKADLHLHKLELIARTLGGANDQYRKSVLGYWQIAMVACIAGAIGLDTLVSMLAGNFGKGTLGRIFAGTFWDWPLILPILILVIGLVASYQFFTRRFRPALVARLDEQLPQYAALASQFDQDLWDSTHEHIRGLLVAPGELSLGGNHRSHALRLEKLRAERIPRSL